MKNIHCILLLGGLTVFIAGCGGGDDESATNKPKQTTVTPTAIADVNTPKTVMGAARPQPQQAVQTGGAKKEPAAGELPPGVAPEDVFMTQGEQNTFVVSATPEDLATFTIAAKPVEGADSSTFDLLTRQSGPVRDPSEYESYKTPPRITVEGGEAEGKLAGLPEGFETVLGSRTHESGIPTRVRNKKDDSEFVLIPAGSFIQGSNTGPANARPEHHVSLDNYYISVHEVTLRQWRMYVNAEHENERQRQPIGPLNASADPEMPALGVPQLEARKYAEWLNCDLPTEAQWEKAARGSQSFVYPWGNGRPIWSRPRDKQEILPVMSWRNDVSTYGIYDLAGNAREWTQDVYREDWYSFIAGEQGEKLVENPTGPKPGAGSYDRVIRGGGDDWKVWYRDQARFSDQVPDVGFRLVINLKPKKQGEEEPQEDSRRSRTTRRNTD